MKNNILLYNVDLTFSGWEKSGERETNGLVGLFLANFMKHHVFYIK